MGYYSQNPIADAHVRSGSEGNDKYGTTEYLYIGENSSGVVVETYINFDLSSIPAGSTITSATLRLHQYDSTQDWFNTEIEVAVKLVESAWAETGITWNSKPGSLSSPQTLKSFAGLTTVDFDVKAHIESILAGTANNGFVLKYTGTSSSTLKNFRSRQYGTASERPLLMIDYTEPTAVGAPTNPTVSPGVYEDSVTFSWGAGAPGVNNAITAYHVYYRLNSGSETGVNAGTSTSYTLDTSSFTRGTAVDFHVASIAQYNTGNPFSGWSNQATKNSIPNIPTGVNLAKSVYVPGEKVRVSFTNPGDPDDNLAGFEAATNANETIVGTNASGEATYVDVDTTNWTPGVSYSFRVRGYDAYGIRGAWSGYVSAMVGLPMKIAATEGNVFKQVAQMKLFPIEGSAYKTVKSMKIMTAENGPWKTVF